MSVPAAGNTRTVVVAALSAVIGVLPVFLTGSLGVFLRADLDFGQARLGLAISVAFLASALAALPGGRLTEQVGARLAMLASAVVGGVAMAGIALTARSWTGLVGWLVLAGIANGVAQPAGNLALTRGVIRARQGSAFGIKQAAIPAATLLAGGGVPLLALTVGWRWAYASGAAGALLLVVLMPRNRYASARPQSQTHLREGDAPIVPLLVLALAATCGAAVGTSLASFYVESAVGLGVAPGRAGLLLVVGSLSGIISRLFLGWFVDRYDRGHLVIVTSLLGVGVVGFAGLATGITATVPLILFSIVAFGAGWGWPGLFNYTIVRLNPSAPALATSITQTGVFIGGVIGPAAFGAIAQAWSVRAAWGMLVVLNLLAAGSVLIGRALLRRSVADRV